MAVRTAYHQHRARPDQAGAVRSAITDANIGTAVTAWLTSPATAATTYGNIGDWDVSGVSNMSGTFQHQPTFNDDISKWNTASASTMSAVCSLPSHAAMRA